MNQSAELLSEDQAAALARVSPSTLARYAEAGYFQVEQTSGERLYSRRALSAVFGITIPVDTESSTTSVRENVIPFPTPTNRGDVAENQSTVAVSDAVEVPDALSECTSEPSPESPIEDPAPLEVGDLSIEASPTESESPVSDFTNIIKMHADILSRQEREIEDLRSERDWLRKRVENLEQKAERDQVLLMSEAQTVKQLILLQAQKKSTLRAALDWLGVTTPNAVESKQITFETKSP